MSWQRRGRTAAAIRPLDETTPIEHESAGAKPRPSAYDHKMERRVAQIRWIGAILCCIAAPFLSLNDSVNTIYLCMAAVAVYNWSFSRLIAADRQSWLIGAYTHGFFDVATATVIVATTGASESPFFLAYFVIVVQVAIRFGLDASRKACAIMALCYIGAIIFGDQSSPAGLWAVSLRIGFLALTAVFAGFLADRVRADSQRLSKHLDRARALNVAGPALTASLEWSDVVQQIAEQGRRLGAADAAIVEFCEPTPGSMSASFASSNERATDVLPQCAYLTKILLQRDLMHLFPSPVASETSTYDLQRADELFGDDAQHLPPGMLLRAPLQLQDTWSGDLVLIRKGVERQFDQTDSDIIEAFARQASLALENARQYHLAKEQAATDPITNMPNHRSLKERLGDELARANRHEQELSVLMLDIDHFKVYNDAFGHAAGDEALRVVADALRQSLRLGDYAARYGGEEFVVVLPDTPLSVASEIAETLRGVVADITEQSANALPRSVTVSIGVATCPMHGGDRDLILQAADSAMYLAKHGGRNQVCLASDLGTERGLHALFNQAISHLALPSSSPGPHVVTDLERRFARLASLRYELDEAEVETAIKDSPMLQTVTALAATIDAKDHYTEGHSRQVAALGASLADAIGCSLEQVEMVRLGGLLHDVGKIGVPEAILNKPGPLDPEEWSTMREHPEIGVRILAPVAALREILPTVNFHHERWDGSGYPAGLRADEIPLHARIIAICDAFDTMVSNRPYRRGMDRSQAVKRLQDGAGTQFDAHLVAAFVRLQETAKVPTPLNREFVAVQSAS